MKKKLVIMDTCNHYYLNGVLEQGIKNQYQIKSKSLSLNVGHYRMVIIDIF